MIKYYIRCLQWLYRNRNWQNSRQKWKAMDREVNNVRNQK